MTRRAWQTLAGVIVVAICAALTAARVTTVWRSDVTLWEDAVSKAPCFRLAQVRSTRAWLSAGDYARAQAMLRRIQDPGDCPSRSR